MSKNKAILSVVGVAIAIMLPLSAVMVFKYKEKSRVTIHFPPTYYPIGIDTVKDPLNGKVRIDTLYRTIPDFKATTQDNQPFSANELKGNLYVAEFFFTSCPGICPLMNKSLQRVQQEFLNDDIVKILSISIDTERDSISVLKEYATNKGAIPGKWTFVRMQNQEAVYDLGKNHFGLTTQQGNSDSARFEHSDKLILIDAEGHIRGYYNGTDSMAVNKLMGDMVLIMSRMKK